MYQCCVDNIALVPADHTMRKTRAHLEAPSGDRTETGYCVHPCFAESYDFEPANRTTEQTTDRHVPWRVPEHVETPNQEVE